MKSSCHRSMISSSCCFIVIIDRKGSSELTSLRVRSIINVVKKMHISVLTDAPIPVLNHVSFLKVNSTRSPNMSKLMKLS